MSCTATHLRSRSLSIVSLSDMIEGSYRSWDLCTTGQRVDGLQQKKENRFSLNRNGIMSSFLGRQFYRSTLYKSRAVGVTSEVGLTVIFQYRRGKETRRFLYIRDTGSHMVRATIQQQYH